ncbi:hypothetical protein ABZU78_11780 [Rhodococcus erythropolis]|uniref:hypothetical protein n=1 Tax=Rhodococcus erythropolis TaxID=1833 RepID=UPI0033B96F65
MWALSIVGKFMEIGGLGMAAYGLVLAWRNSTAGAPFLPESILRRLRGGRSATVYVAAASAGSGALNANIRVGVDPSRPLSERVTELETRLNVYQLEVVALDSRLRQHADESEAEHGRLEQSFHGELARGAFTQSRNAVVELRVAAVGLGITALGALFQLPLMLMT